MMNKEKIAEETEYKRIQTYHGQLWQELILLFQLYNSLCSQHKHETEFAVARAALFTIFGTIETSSRVIAACTLFADACSERNIHLETEDYPQPIHRLSNAEKLFLRQETEEIDKRKWLAQRRSKFVSFETALIGYPQIYARIFGIEFSIDKSCSEWQSLKELKTLRDLGAHGNISNSELKSYSVTTDDLEELLIARRWYCEQLKSLPWIVEAEASGEIQALNILMKLLVSKQKCH